MLAYVVELAEDQLDVQPIHRLVTGLPAGFDLLGRASDRAFVADRGRRGRRGHRGGAWPSAARSALVDPDRVLVPRAPRPRPRRPVATSTRPASTRALAALPVGDVAFQHGVDRGASTRSARGEAQAGFLLRPATVAQIVDIAHGGERMPPKSTFFSPKPRTGMVFRSLDE